jgi:carbon starvation protein CstA
MLVPTLNYSAVNYSAGKYSVWNSFGGKEPWSNDICAVVALLMLAYYILDHQIRRSVRKLVAAINTAEYSAIDMAEKGELELETTKKDFDKRLTAFQDDALRRLENLELALKGLVAAELGLMKTTTTQMRNHLEKGGLWGRQKEKLRGKLEEAAQRELAWTKAMNSV